MRFKVTTFSGTVWHRIMAFRESEVLDGFLQLTFDDGLYVLLPKSDIKSIEKLK